MSIDIHNHDDDQYRRAYERLEEEPSQEVWNKVMAALDGRDAKYYQKKSVKWKRTSLILLLMLGAVTISGLLYVSKKQSGIETVSTNSAGGKSILKKTVPGQQLQKDNNTITENTHKREIYAISKQTKSDSNRIEPTIQSGTNQLDEIPKQDAVAVRKQYSKQVQNTSVTKWISIIQKKSFDENHHPFIGKQDLSTYQQKRMMKEQKVPVSFSDYSAKQEPFTNKEAANSHQQRTTTERESASLPLAAPYADAHSIATKETMDTNVSAQINAITESVKKNNVTDEANTAVVESSKAIKIARLSKPHISLTAYSSVDFSQYHLDDDEHGNNNNRHENKHEIEERESHGFSFSTGLFARLQTTKKLSVKAGLIYSNTTINIQPQTVYASPDGNQNIAYKFITSSGYAYVKPVNGTALVAGDSAKANHSQNQLQFLSTPVMLGFTAYTNKRFIIIPSIGAAANFLLGTKVKTEINEPLAKQSIHLNRLNGSQSWHLSFVADAELQYQVTKNMNITLLPSMRYALSPITQNNAVKTFPYSFGLGLGVTYHF